MGHSFINNLTISVAETSSKTFKYAILIGSVFNMAGS